MSVFRTVALGREVEEMMLALYFLVCFQRMQAFGYPPVQLLAEKLGAITWPMNSLWAKSIELVVWTFLWRKHPSLWSGISHRDSSIFASEHGKTEK